MKISSIVGQVKSADRYSIFIDGKYAFSLSEQALLESKLVKGQELGTKEIGELKKLSNDDKLYLRALKLVAARPKTEFEVRRYLKQKEASPALTEKIVNKLREISLIDDSRYAESFVSSRRLHRPSSRRKIWADLKKRGISNEVIENYLPNDSEAEYSALLDLIAKKRSQAKYSDDNKLMQYLARQGFSYDDIKRALKG